MWKYYKHINYTKGCFIRSILSIFTVEIGIHLTCIMPEKPQFCSLTFLLHTLIFRPKHSERHHKRIGVGCKEEFRYIMHSCACAYYYCYYYISLDKLKTNGHLGILVKPRNLWAFEKPHNGRSWTRISSRVSKGEHLCYSKHKKLRCFRSKIIVLTYVIYKFIK